MRKFEKLTNLFFALMAIGEDPSASELLLWASSFTFERCPAPCSRLFQTAS